jgi:hypothetical protein
LKDSDEGIMPTTAIVQQSTSEGKFEMLEVSLMQLSLANWLYNGDQESLIEKGKYHTYD